MDSIVGGISRTEVAEVDLLDMAPVHPSFQRFEVLAPIEIGIEQHEMTIDRPANDPVEERETMRVHRNQFNGSKGNGCQQNYGAPLRAHFVGRDSRDKEAKGVDGQNVSRPEVERSSQGGPKEAPGWQQEKCDG